MDNIRLGDPLDKAVDMGAIIDPKQLKTIKEMVKIGVDEGCTMYQPKNGVPENGRC